MSVVLPAPFSPRTAWISPGQRSSETRSLARTGPKRLVMSRISTMGALVLPLPSPIVMGEGVRRFDLGSCQAPR